MTPFIEKIRSKKRLQLLRKLAQEEFESARGTAHLHLLKSSQLNIQGKLKRVRRDIEVAKGELTLIKSKENGELTFCLEKYLVTNRLKEVPGIGVNLSQAIAHSVFRKDIRDLYNAYSIVPGIGPNKQQTINLWVTNYFYKLPILLIEPFPGKDAIMKKWKQTRKETQIELEHLLTQQKELEGTLSQVAEIISQLQVIREEDFLNALLNPQSTDFRIEYYQRGVFAEWEPIPEWFKKILAESELENV